MPRPMFVATAAPVTPISGNGPQPKMKHGPSTMFSALASQSVRIAITASPAPRKIALMRKIRNTVALPPSMMRAKSGPSVTIAFARAHHSQDVRREASEHDTESRRHADAEQHDLPRRVRRGFRILFADAPRDDRGRRDRNADRDRVDERHDRLGDADHGDRILAQPRNPEHVRDGEERLHHHLEHHRHREQDYRAVQPFLRVIVMLPAQRLRNRTPKRGRFGGCGLCVGHGHAKQRR